MKRIRIFTIAGLFNIMFLTTLSVNAQIGELGNLMAAGGEDATELLQPYIEPAVNAFGAALGGGWYNTAKPHQLGGFDITFTANVALVPEKFRSFEIDNDKLTLLQLADPLDNVSPSIAGDKTDGPQIVYNFDEFSQPAFTMPMGLNAKYVPSPMIQAGVGLIKGTELMIRYLPNIPFEDNEIGLWGIGGKHDIKQWIPGLKRMPILQISVMYGYTKLHTYVALQVDPDNIGVGSLPGSDVSEWDNQQLQLTAESHTANLLISANLPVICFYGGAGFVNTKTNLKLIGDYPVVYINETTPSVKVLSDPLDIQIENKEGGLTKPRFNAGIRLKFAVVTLHVDYSWANYSVLTAGLGISFR